MNIEQLNKLCDNAQDKINLSRKAFPRIMEIESRITTHYFYYYPMSAQIIACVPTREDFAPLRALKTGKWDKEIRNDEGVTVAEYLCTSDDGICVCVRVRELPPSCRIVRAEIELPAQPARTKIVERVICDKSTREEVLAESVA